MPKTPEQWLEETAPRKKHPVFKLFLGYAPGVGKTFNMLSEGIRRHSRGEDVGHWNSRNTRAGWNCRIGGEARNNSAAQDRVQRRNF